MPDDSLIPNAWIEKVRSRTPARLLIGRAGGSYLTSSQLDLRQAHAAAADAVHHELDLHRTLGRDLVEKFMLFEVESRAKSKAEYLLCPDLGRALSQEGKKSIAERCPSAADIQIVIGDGLSVSAVAVQVPKLLPLLVQGSKEKGWSVGQAFVVRHCRVGVLNDVGEILKPKIAVLLIGERPGLATAESLSAYMAYRPSTSHNDADRNLVSNIHMRGTPPELAADRILQIASAMRRDQLSGTRLHVSGKALVD